ncbi:sensor histidine kinase [Actinoplanes bogorensis]|uniref:histidine kinase n=1 Tax=Paractinoplanes bogorensis TaxID=1610840 RepID=A0ABS5YSJ8_9ACTN|nr:histidine kinase [Actinoplanes bogorensis]MBU2666431.1 sensor histidine kinase [Actinoplanes bogorensis]
MRTGLHLRRRADLIGAVMLWLLLTSLLVITPGGPQSGPAWVAAFGLATIQAGAVAWVRHRPETAMAVAIVAGVGIEALSPDVGWLGQVAAVLASYALVRPPRRSLWILGLLVAATPWKLATGDWRNLMLAVAGPALGWALGELGRVRRLRRQDAERRILAQERARIARELHDVLTHTVSVIVVQAGAAADIFDARPDLARKALGAIDTAARSTLAELRVLLQTMSAGEASGVDVPQPGLDQLGSLTAGLRETGLRVELDHRPGGEPLPAAVDLSAYRIVQESLTNTLRHSRSTHARVSVTRAPASILVEISDDGPARATGRADASGHRGIVGMRERARLLGGTLDAGPQPGGGFRVLADLPIPADGRASR